MNGKELPNIKCRLIVEDLKKQLNECRDLSLEVQKTASLGVYVLDVETGIWTSSPELDEIFGIDKKYKKNINSWLKIVSKEDKEVMKKYFTEEVLGKKREFDKIYRIHRRNDGKELWVHGHGKLEMDDNGRIKRMVGTIQDITREKMEENVLVESEKKYRKLHDSLLDAFVVVTMNGRLIEFNNIFVKMLGYKKSELLKMTYKDLTPKKWLVFEEELINKQILKNNVSDVYEKEYVRKDGSIFPVELRTYLMRDENGKPEAMWAIVRDITDRKRIEKELVEEKEKLSSVLKNTAHGIVMVDIKARIILANPFFCKLVGYSESELQKITFKEITCEDDLEESEKQMRLLAEGKISHFAIEKRYVKKNNEIFWGRVSVSAICDIKGKPYQFVASIEDITDRRKEDQVLRDFVSLAGHQLRTPLTGIKWFVELIKNRSDNIAKEELNDCIKNISDSNERLIQLVNDLLHVSRIESGKIKSVIIESNVLFEILNDSVVDQQMLIKEKGIKISGLSNIPRSIKIKCDKAQMVQVFGNIISNAVKYSPLNSEVRIGVSKKNAGKVMVVISDSGMGIPKHQQFKLFEKFFRADNVSNVSTGSGLGLYLVKNLVELNGGKVKIESEEGKGTKVFVEMSLSGK